MAEFLPDEIVMNIVARLPTKPLLRFRCVSKYWNRVLNEPHIMKLRSRRMTILPLNETLHLIDDNEDKSNWRLKRCFPLDDSRLFSTIVGSFNGIVLLAYRHRTMILYNPFTGASEELPSPVVSANSRDRCGFGYGENPDDLKIFWFRLSGDICDVFSFKNSSWSPWITSQYNVSFKHKVGKFLNGFLHWITSQEDMLAFLDVKEMVISYIRLPFEKSRRQTVLGTVDGCLCTLDHISNNTFHMYVMKEHGNEDSWMHTYSFTLDFKGYRDCWHFQPLGILDNCKILMETPPFARDFKQLIIYNPFKHSYKKIGTPIYRLCRYWTINLAEYVETLVSPSTFLGNAKP